MNEAASQQPAALIPLAAACTTPTTGVPVHGGSGAAPWIDDTLQLALASLWPTDNAALGVFGVDATAWNGLPLPLDLGAIGVSDCELQVRIDVTTALSSDVWSMAVPNLTALVGRPRLVPGAGAGTRSQSAGGAGEQWRRTANRSAVRRPPASIRCRRSGCEAAPRQPQVRTHR